MATVDVERPVRILKALPERKAWAALYFLELLAIGDEGAQATSELLDDADFVNAVTAADEARRAGRLDEFVPWRAVKPGV